MCSIKIGLRILKSTCRDKPRIGTVPLDIHFFKIERDGTVNYGTELEKKSKIQLLFKQIYLEMFALFGQICERVQKLKVPNIPIEF